MTQPEDTRYGRCEATAKSTGEQCGRAAIGDHGKCGYHGGKGGAPSGDDNGQWKHGLTSGVVRPQDEPLLEAVEGLSPAEMLQEILEYQVMKLYRALDSLESEHQTDIMDALAGLINSIENPETADLREVAKMLGQNERVIQEQIQLIVRTAEKLNKIRDGETVNVQHGADGDDLEELKNMADDLF
jgi:hypothetical protein